MNKVEQYVQIQLTEKLKRKRFWDGLGRFHIEKSFICARIVLQYPGLASCILHCSHLYVP